jgi:hypothetical protein
LGDTRGSDRDDHPIPPERFDAWRAAVAEMAEPRRAEFAAARLRQGIERQAVWVQ